MPGDNVLEMKEVRLEHDVGEIFRLFGPEYEKRYPMSRCQRKALRALAVCRTAYLGGHLEQCEHCGFERSHYNSCRNVNCPKCQGIQRRKWVTARLSEMLPVPYFHVVFTVPSSMSDALIGFERILYRVLFQASSQTLLHFFKDRYGSQPGLISVLHTWGQTMSRHPHVHFLVTGGGLSLDRNRWISTSDRYLFDVKKFSKEFRARFLKGLKKAKIVIADGVCEEEDWVVYCQKPFAGAERVIEYLGRYTYRTAISNRRIRSVSANEVTFDYKDYRDEDENGIPKHKLMTVDGVTFIRLFLQHILPSGFRRIRFYGILAGRERAAKLERCRELLCSLIIDDSKTSLDEGTSKIPLCPQCGKGEFIAILNLEPIRPPPITFANERKLNRVA